MEFSGINEFLIQYKERLFGEEEKKKKILQIIKERTGMTLEEKAITLSQGVIQCAISPAEKNELFLHSQTIIEECKKQKIFISTIR